MATYSQVCSNVGSFTLGNRFTLYVVLTNRDGNPSTNKSVVDYNVYFENTSGGGTFTSRTRLYFALNGGVIKDTTSEITGPRNGSVLIASGSTQIDHNSDGTRSISYHALVKSSSFGISGEISGTFTLNTIPRASTITCSTANIEEKATITITSASASFVHNVFGAFGNQEFSVASNRAGGTFTWTIPSSFYKQIPDNPMGRGTLHCQTYSGSTLIGTTSILFYVTTSKEKCTPSISGTVVDTNQTTINLTGDANKLIKYKSTAKATISASAKNSASISKKVINGTTVSGNELSIANVSTTSFVFETVDSRGYPNSTTVTPQMIDYVPLTINATFFRPQPTTGEVKLKYSGNYFDGNFGAKQNSIGIEWHYRVKGSSTWIKGGNITPTISENKIVEQTISLGTNFDYQTAYEFYIYAQDLLTSFSTTIPVSVGMPVFYWGKDFFTVTGKFNANTYFSGVITPQCWYYIGNFELGLQGSYAVLDCYLGEGQNGWPGQNTHARILLKQGWAGDTSPIGVTTKFTQNYSSLIKVKIRHITKTNCALYIYLPFNYNDLTYVISGSYSSFGLSNTVLSEEPTTDKESTYYKDFEPVSLYDNSSGTTGTVPLSESAANFSYLEIFFSTYDEANRMVSNKISTPNGKISRLLFFGSTYMYYKDITISGTSITVTNNSRVAISNGTGDTTNEIKIYKVVGYR